MTEFKIAERSLDPDDYVVTSPEWDESQWKAERAERLAETEREIAESIKATMLDIFGDSYVDH